MKEPKTIYYASFSDDVIVNANQDYTLPGDYRWMDDGRKGRFLSRIVYGAAVIFSFFYTKLVWHMKVENQEVLSSAGDRGYFLYANHTQPFGDVFFPAWVNLKKRIYVIVSQANYGLPVIGKLLPYLGALPLGKDLKGMENLRKAVDRRIQEKKCVVVYPEAHVWPYYTKIRPFSDTAFHYPVNLGAPVFAMTTTYQKRKNGKRPRITIYVDGPFFPDTSLSKRAQRQTLCAQVRAAMTRRSQMSNCEYVTYVQRKPDGEGESE